MSTITSTRRYTAKEQMILDAGIAMGKGEGYKKGFREGANYLYTLINNNTIISELYGWKTVLDDCMDKTKELLGPEEKIKEETYTVSKNAYPSPSEAYRVVKAHFPKAEIKRYGLESGYDSHGTLLNHENYYYFRITDEEKNL